MISTNVSRVADLAQELVAGHEREIAHLRGVAARAAELVRAALPLVREGLGSAYVRRALAELEAVSQFETEGKQKGNPDA